MARQVRKVTFEGVGHRVEARQEKEKAHTEDLVLGEPVAGDLRVQEATQEVVAPVVRDGNRAKLPKRWNLFGVKARRAVQSRHEHERQRIGTGIGHHGCSIEEKVKEFIQLSALQRGVCR